MSDEGSPSCFVELTERGLEGWPKRLAKEVESYVASQEGPLQLVDLVNSYVERIQRFYNWLEGRLRAIHRMELEELEEIRNEAAAWRTS